MTKKKYSKATGVNAQRLLKKIRKTIDMLTHSEIDYEFRTTVVPTLHEESDIKEICYEIEGCKKYVLQRFYVSPGKATISPKFNKLILFTDEEMRCFLTLAQNILSNVKLR